MNSSTIGVVLLLASTATAGSGYVCPHLWLDTEEWVETYLEIADSVFLGTVTSVEISKQPYWKPEQSLESTLGLDQMQYQPWETNSHLSYVATVEVEQSWKGSGESTLVVRAPIYGTIGRLMVGDELLFFARPAQTQGELLVNFLCRETLEKSMAEDRIRALNELRPDD